MKLGRAPCSHCTGTDGPLPTPARGRRSGGSHCTPSQCGGVTCWIPKSEMGFPVHTLHPRCVVDEASGGQQPSSPAAYPLWWFAGCPHGDEHWKAPAASRCNAELRSCPAWRRGQSPSRPVAVGAKARARVVLSRPSPGHLQILPDPGHARRETDPVFPRSSRIL